MPNIYDVITKESDNSKVLPFYNEAMKELIDFYGINWVDNTSVIYLVNSREDFNLISGYETEDWVTGRVLSHNKLLLLSPESYEKESIHKYTDKEYYSLLKHELSHLFYMILSQGKGPIWLDEGFAVYVSDQLSTKERPKEFKSFLNYYSHEDKDVYSEAGFVVEGLIKRYGKNRVINFLRRLPNINNKKEFKKEFEEYFKLRLEYKQINLINI
ncbi:hypothetical protein KBH77_02495 [Patescibacteria group bacterium]|nr:hypothetical protein [Patescibacteria group bacterium]